METRRSGNCPTLPSLRCIDAPELYLDRAPEKLLQDFPVNLLPEWRMHGSIGVERNTLPKTERADEMNKISLVRTIVKLYFLAAIVGSFTHIIESAHKLGLTGWEMWSTPFMIDGLAIIGMVMRSADFSKATRKTGLRVQLAAGVLSLAANIYAADTIGGYIFGVGIVTLFLVAERLADKIESAQVDRDRELSEKRSAAASKAAATRKANAAKKARKRKAETRELEALLTR